MHRLRALTSKQRSNSRTAEQSAAQETVRRSSSGENNADGKAMLIAAPEAVTQPEAQAIMSRRSASRVSTSNAEEEAEEAGDQGFEPRYVHSASAIARSPAIRKEDAASAVPLGLQTRPCTREFDEAADEQEVLDSEGVNRLVAKLESKEQVETVVAEIRRLARHPCNRRTLCQEKLLKLLIPLLHGRSAAARVDSAAAVLNLSLDKDNKSSIARAGMMPPLIYVLRTGAAESQELVAAAIFSLAVHEENRIALGVLGAIPPLVALLKDGRATPAAADAAMGLYYLSLAQINRSKMVKAGAVPMLLAEAEGGGETGSRALCILNMLAAAKEGRAALLECGGVERLFAILAAAAAAVAGGEVAEHAAATLLQLSRRNFRFRHLAEAAGGAAAVAALLESPTVTPRGAEKAAALQSVLREPQPGSLGPRESYNCYPRAYVRRSSGDAAEQQAAKAGSSHF